MFEEYERLLVWLLPIILLAIIILPQMIRILREYQRGVIFHLGKLLGAKGPGNTAMSGIPGDRLYAYLTLSTRWGIAHVSTLVVYL